MRCKIKTPSDEHHPGTKSDWFGAELPALQNYLYLTLVPWRTQKERQGIKEFKISSCFTFTRFYIE